MEGTYRKPTARAGLGALAALVAMLAGTGTCVASGPTEPVALATVAEAPALAQGAGYGSAVEAKRVRVLQRTLRQLGWAPGPVDGLFGPRTEAAVLRFQAAGGLAVDGVVGAHTWKALRRAGRGVLARGAGYQRQSGSRRVRALQRRLDRAGLAPGPVDGRYGPRTEAAVVRLQRAANLKASGAADSRTRRVLARGLDRRAAERQVAARLKAILPQALRSTAVTPLAQPAVDTGQRVPVWLAVAIAALALLVGALCVGLVVRARSRRQAERPDAPRGDEAERPDAPRRDEEVQPEVLPAAQAPQVVAEQQTQEEMPVRPVQADQPVRAVGYVSVPQASGENGAALEAQADAIQRLCERRGWELLHVVRDVENGHAKGMERPGLLYALERIAEGEASCLVVSELERLSRSAADLGRIVEWIDERDARLVAIDLRLDTGSAQGRLTARTLVAVGEWEGRRIAEQTKKGLAAARARRASTGRPAVDDVPALKERIVAMRRQGMTLQAIADQLNAEDTPTLRGGAEWRPSSVQAAAGYRRPKGRRSELNNAHREDPM